MWLLSLNSGITIMRRAPLQVPIQQKVSAPAPVRDLLNVLLDPLSRKLVAP
jgi:hypothetical protein